MRGNSFGNVGTRASNPGAVAVTEPTSDDKQTLLLCEAMIRSGEVDEDPEAAALVDAALVDMASKYPGLIARNHLRLVDNGLAKKGSA